MDNLFICEKTRRFEVYAYSPVKKLLYIKLLILCVSLLNIQYQGMLSPLSVNDKMTSTRPVSVKYVLLSSNVTSGTIAKIS